MHGRSHAHVKSQGRAMAGCGHGLMVASGAGTEKASRLRWKQGASEAEGSLLDMPNKVMLKGLASSVLSAALLGKAAAADALSCRGIFDR